MSWQFTQTNEPARPWRWKRSDDNTGSVLQQSDESFTTLYAAVEDAKRHGYTAPRADRAA